MYVSWDGGKNYAWDTVDTMTEIKLFLSNSRIEYTYHVQSYLDVLAKFGGLMGSIFLIFSSLGEYLNKEL